ncbi:MAG: hypothetical protein H7244_05595 [Herminiimonas sp.]|nr:hypothetical protein [Herminiimonas sp.]
MITPFSFAPASGLQPARSGFGAPRYRYSRAVAMVLAVLLHALLLWLILRNDPMVLKLPSAGNETAITYIAPLALAPVAKPVTPQKKPPPKPPEKQPRKPKAVQKPPAQVRPAQPRKQEQPPQLAATEPLTPAPNIAPQPDAVREPPAEDFSSRIEANRKRRAEAQAQDPSLAQAAPETESQHASRVARENIAFQQRGVGASGEKDDTGGVFQLRDVRTHSAEFMFRGWNTNFKRKWSQVVAVDQGTEPDIELAVVKRMIALIRTHKTGEFIWESHRLGRQITLNADAAYEAALQQFLLKEFFPTYVRSSGRG